jgi:hypothetical protein
MRMILDAGALIAIDRADSVVRARLASAHRRSIDVITTSPVVAQVWRQGRTQANLARTLPGIHVFAPTEGDARRCGELLAATRTTDVVDGFVAVLARDGDIILTSDIDDLRALTKAARLTLTVVAV